MTSVTMLLCWYSLIFISFFVGQKLGGILFLKRISPSDSLLNLDSNLIYYIFTAISALGIGTMLIKIFGTLSVKDAILFISLGQTNALKDTLYEDYSVGLVSLRYLVLYPASVALYRIIRNKQFKVINIFNVFLLAMGTFLSSRLILMATIIVTSYLVT
jgi:hypothetical protein